MAHIDTEALLQEIESDNACGEELEYDPLFAEMEAAVAGKPKQQVGDSFIEGQEPEWERVQELALELFTRTKDLRVAVNLCRAMTATQGVSGTLEALKLLHGLIERYWDEIHPRLDPDDGNDPTHRLNVIGSLADSETVPRNLREAPLVSMPQVGAFSLRDIEIAKGELLVPEPDEDEAASRPDLALIEGALSSSDIEFIQDHCRNAGACVENIRAIESSLAMKVGAGQTPDLEPLTRVLESIEKVFAQQLSARGVDIIADEGGSQGNQATEAESDMDEVRSSSSGGINSRTDVIRALDEICKYFETNEPSSPVPLLLRRVRNLVPMNFVEIVRDLAPDGMSQIETIFGNLQGPDS